MAAPNAEFCGVSFVLNLTSAHARAPNGTVANLTAAKCSTHLSVIRESGNCSEIGGRQYSKMFLPLLPIYVDAVKTTVPVYIWDLPDVDSILACWHIRTHLSRDQFGGNSWSKTLIELDVLDREL